MKYVIVAKNPVRSWYFTGFNGSIPSWALIVEDALRYYSLDTAKAELLYIIECERFSPCSVEYTVELFVDKKEHNAKLGANRYCCP